jgi:hypothetical protein
MICNIKHKNDDMIMMMTMINIYDYDDVIMIVL